MIIARAAVAVVLYVAAVVAANVLTSRYGTVPVGFGLTATAGVYCAGAVLTVRDTVQEAGGRRLAVACILAGAALSAAFGSGRIAAASAVAFLLAELADFAVYTATRRYGWTPAVWASFAVSAPFDTWLFLVFAGFPVTGHGLAGQLLGKTWATAAAWALTFTAPDRGERCSTS
jgi:queuosine precursor transporter